MTFDKLSSLVAAADQQAYLMRDEKTQVEVELWYMRRANDAEMAYRGPTVRHFGRHSCADLEPLIVAGLAEFKAGFWITEKGREVLAECERRRHAG